MGMLRERMIREMELGRYSPRTQEAYVAAVAALARYYRRPPDRLGGEEVKSYLHHLLVERKLAWSSVNVASAAIRFFFSRTLGRDDVSTAIPPRRTPLCLPHILSKQELERLFENERNVKHRALLMTTYAAGLRVSEVVRLKVTDIDSDRMLIRVRQGKGEKDRDTLLSERLLGELRCYWSVCRPPRPWLFVSERTGQPLPGQTAGKIFTKAKRKAGIHKPGGIHMLRHAFATHLLEAGVDIRVIQLLLGHKSIRTTAGYVRVTRKAIDATHSPLDLLDLPDRRPAR